MASVKSASDADDLFVNLVSDRGSVPFSGDLASPFAQKDPSLTFILSRISPIFLSPHPLLHSPLSSDLSGSRFAGPIMKRVMRERTCRHHPSSVSESSSCCPLINMGEEMPVFLPAPRSVPKYPIGGWFRAPRLSRQRTELNLTCREGDMMGG